MPRSIKRAGSSKFVAGENYTGGKVPRKGGLSDQRKSGATYDMNSGTLLSKASNRGGNNLPQPGTKLKTGEGGAAFKRGSRSKPGPSLPPVG